MELTSPAFEDGEAIPELYTCDGDPALSPPLQFAEVPKEARSLVLIVDDPDVPAEVLPSRVYDHWVLYNIDPETGGIEEGSTAGTPGRNSAGENRYTGPCPPPEYEPSEHRYLFTLYALDAELPLSEGAEKEEVLAHMDGHILAEAQLVGRYERADTG